MFYTYPKDNYRARTLIPRGTGEWEKFSGFGYIIVQVISRLKLPLQLGSLYLRNRKTIKADFFIAGAAHLITVFLAYKMDCIDKIRSPRSITA